MTGGKVGYIFTGLSPAKKYKFTATAVRGGAPAGGAPNYYSNRWTQAELVGAASFTHNHSAGVITSNQFPAFLQNSQAALNTGVNTNGDVIQWNSIEPTLGADGNGTFTVLMMQYTNGIPGSPSRITPQLPTYAYVLGQIRLEETGLPDPPQLAVEQDRTAGTVTISWPLSPLPCQVSATEDLTTPRQNWSVVTGGTFATNAGRVSITIPTSGERRFFDVRYP